jgi:membrane associated rhomboid family serine protease
MFKFIHPGYLSNFLIALTSLISYAAWKKPKIQDALISNGPAIFKQHQWYRTITSSLLHADWGHLFWNMLALYNFGPILEGQFQTYLGKYWFIWFILFYKLTALLSDLPSSIRHRNDEFFSSLGASGAIAAVIAAASIINLKLKIIVYGVSIYGWMYLIGYLLISFYLSRKSAQRINHLAHAGGTIAGVLIAVLVAHGGLITSSYPTEADYEKGLLVTSQALTLLNKANNGLVWSDVSNKYGTRMSLGYLTTADKQCDVVIYRSDKDAQFAGNSFPANTYSGYGQVQSLGNAWVLVNASSNSSPCYLATKQVFNWG